MVNLESYRAFYIVAKQGSLTAAAKELYISQPALSQSIQNLEGQLGGRLFVRTPKGMVLTPEGAKLYEYVEQGLNIFDTAQKSFEEMKHLKAGNIRIGASDTLCRHYLLKIINKFHLIYPEIGIQVTNRTTRETVGLLRSGKVDIAFVNLPISDVGLDIKSCMELQDCFVGNKEYSRCFKEKISLEKLAEAPLIMIEKLSNTRRYIDDFMLTHGIRVTPAFELGSFDLVVEFAKSGLGIGCVTKEFVTDEIKRGELYEIPIDVTIPKRAIGSVLMKNTPLTFAADSFRKLIM